METRKFVVDATVRFWIDAENGEDAENQFDEFIAIAVRDTRTGEDFHMEYRDTWIEVV